MAALTHVCIITCLILGYNLVIGIQPINGKIKITIGTSAGCSATAKFINEQLVDVYRQHGNSLDLEFVPWGRTARDLTGALVCQFGERDCWANRLHRCALNMLRGNQSAQLNYMICEYSSPFPSYVQGSYLCAQSVGLPLNDLTNCMARTSDELDREAEEAARLPIQIINFVPSISINDIHDVGLHNEAMHSLSNLIAMALVEPTTANPTTSDFYNTPPWIIE